MNFHIVKQLALLTIVVFHTSLFAQWSGTTNIYNTNEGNVGVGTSAPTEKLHVKGNIKVEQSNNPSYYGLLAHDNGNLILRSYYLSGREPIRIQQQQGSTTYERMIIDANGNVGIGTLSPGSNKLSVNGAFNTTGNANITGTLTTGGTITVKNGNIVLQNGKVTIRNWTLEAPDYVFDSSYKPMSLNEVEGFIKKHKHLPEIPSAAEMKKDGVDIVEMNMLLLKKVEELTLQIINQEKKIEKLQSQKGVYN